MKQNSSKFGFCQGMTYPAVVQRVKENKVIFTITNQDGNKQPAVYFSSGMNSDLRARFTSGTKTTVRVVRLIGKTQHYFGVTLISPRAVPTVERFLQKNRLGTSVEGIVENITGPVMKVFLSEGVVCTVKTLKKVSSGDCIKCKLQKYRPANRSLTISCYPL